jgi:hypothetical protein
LFQLLEVDECLHAVGQVSISRISVSAKSFRLNVDHRIMDKISSKNSSEVNLISEMVARNYFINWQKRQKI